MMQHTWDKKLFFRCKNFTELESVQSASCCPCSPPHTDRFVWRKIKHFVFLIHGFVFFQYITLSIFVKVTKFNKTLMFKPKYDFYYFPFWFRHTTFPYSRRKYYNNKNNQFLYPNYFPFVVITDSSTFCQVWLRVSKTYR